MTLRASLPIREEPQADPLFRPPGWVWSRAGTVGWWVRPDWRESLLGPDGLKLDQWKGAGLLTTIKTGPQRVVYRANLPEGAVFVKHFKVPSWRELLRQWFRRGKGRNEGKRSLRLARVGIPTITPIALGEQRRRKFLFENYLITPEIPGMVALDTFLEQRLPQFPARTQGRLHRELGRSLADLTARLHEAGFVHQDFHPGNLLVGIEPDGEIRLAMIDLDALRFRRNLDWRDAEANLALLNHYFWLRCSRPDRHRFLRAYLDRRTGTRPDIHRFAVRIEKATRSWAERLWRRWGRRCRKTNKYFRVYPGKSARGVTVRELSEATVRELLHDLDAPFRDPAARILKDSRTTTVAEWTLPVEGRPTRVIYKRFNRKKWLDPILTLFRPTRAWRAWQSGQHLASRAVPTPKNLAYFQRSRSNLRFLPHRCLPHESYLVTIKAEPSITLLEFIDQVLPGLSPDHRRRAIRSMTRALARLIRTLHDRSLSQRDLKAANILIEGDPLASEPRLSLIDLVGARLEHPLPFRRRAQNLARLHLSLNRLKDRTRTDTLRFLRAYLPWSLTPKTHRKALWRAIARRGQAKVLRNQRRDRILS